MNVGGLDAVEGLMLNLLTPKHWLIVILAASLNYAQADEQPSFLSQGMLDTVMWLQPDTPNVAGWKSAYENLSEPGDGWLAKMKKTRADIVLKIAYHYRGSSCYCMIVLNDGSAFQWRRTPMAIQNALEVREKFTTTELSALRALDEQTDLDHLDSKAERMADVILLGYQKASIGKNPIKIVRLDRLPKKLRSKLGFSS